MKIRNLLAFLLCVAIARADVMDRLVVRQGGNITNITAVNLTGSLTNISLGGTTIYSGAGSNDLRANTLFNLGLRGVNGETVSVYPTAHTTKNIASLVALNTGLVTTNATVEVRGYYEPGDGGGGTFYYAPFEATNRGTVFQSGSGSFVWKRLIDGNLTPKMFGAVPYKVAYSPYVGEAYSPAMPGTNDFTVWVDWQVPTYPSDATIASSVARLSGGQDGLVENSFEAFGATNYFALLVRTSSGASSAGAGAGQFVGGNPFLAYQGTRIQTAFVRTNGTFKIYHGTNDITSGFSATNPGQLAANIGNGETTGVMATASINQNLPRSPIFALKFFTNALTLSQIAAASTATNYVATTASPNLETSLTNSGPAIQAAIDYAAESGIATVQLSGGYYLTDSQINLRPGVNLLGFGSSSWNGNRSAASAPTKIGLTFDSTATNVLRVDRAYADFAQANLDTIFSDGSYATNYYFGGSIRHLWVDASPSKYAIPFELYKVSNYQVEDVVVQQYYGAMFRTYAGNAIGLRQIYAAPSLGGLRGGIVLYTADAHLNDFDYGGTDGNGLLLYSSGKNQLKGNFIWNQLAASGSLTAPTVDTGADTFAATSHNFFTGMPVRFLANGGTLPSPLDEGVMYWAIRVDANTIAVNTQYDQGVAGGALQGVKLNLTTGGSGSWVMRPYTRFDGNVVIANSSSVRIDGGRFDQAAQSALVLDDCFSVAVSANFTEAGYNGSSSTPGIIIAGGGTNSIINSQVGQTRPLSASTVGVLLTNTVANIVRNNTYYNLNTPLAANSLTALANPDVRTVQGDFVIGTSALATTATNGFIALPTTAGTPTGTPTDYGDVAPAVMDSTNHRLFAHDGSWWHAPMWPTAGAASVSANSVLTLTPDAGYTPLVTRAAINGNSAELYNANSTLPGVRIMTYAANGSTAAPSQVTASQTIFDLQPGARHNSSGYNNGYVRLRALTTENQTPSAAGAYWLFGATASGTSVTNVLAVQGNGIDVTGRTETDTLDLGNSDTTLARSAAGVVTIEGVKIATQPATETLTYSGGTNVTITAGKGPNQRSVLTVTNNFQLLWSGLTDNDSGMVHLIPDTTNRTILVSSPGRAAGSSAATATGSTTLTITGATNGWAELAWSVVPVGGTNRVSVNLGAY